MIVTWYVHVFWKKLFLKNKLFNIFLIYFNYLNYYSVVAHSNKLSHLLTSADFSVELLISTIHFIQVCKIRLFFIFLPPKFETLFKNKFELLLVIEHSGLKTPRWDSQDGFPWDLDVSHTRSLGLTCNTDSNLAICR